jgi:hypothetical protein
VSVGISVVLIVMGLPLAVLAGLLPSELDREAAPTVLGWLRPAGQGVPRGLWWRIVRRAWRRGRRLRTLAAPLALALYVASGVLRTGAVAVRLADLGAERLAWRADAYADDPMFPTAPIRTPYGKRSRAHAPNR